PDIAFSMGILVILINNTEDNLSTSGWVFLLGGGAISWASKKQACITGSTMEYEFVALAAAVKEAKWLKNLLFEIPLWSKPIAHRDGQSTRTGWVRFGSGFAGLDAGLVMDKKI
ncbi:zinc finger, CCHC-type containing protein, partial [Tanacetum coccineum]